MRFVTNVEFGEFHDLRRHSSDKVGLLEDFLNEVVDFDDDMVVLKVWA